MSKIKLAKEIVEQLESLKKVHHSDWKIFKLHEGALKNGGWRGIREPLNQIDGETMHHALWFGYEVDEASGKITKFSDIELGMVVRPINGNPGHVGIIDELTPKDKAFSFSGQWGWEHQLGVHWEIVDTVFKIQFGKADAAIETVCDDVTDLTPDDYKSMLAIAFLSNDDEWFAELEKKANGVAE